MRYVCAECVCVCWMRECVYASGACARLSLPGLYQRFEVKYGVADFARLLLEMGYCRQSDAPLWKPFYLDPKGQNYIHVRVCCHPAPPVPAC